MSSYFLDASAVVKRYARERGSQDVEALTAPEEGHHLVLSEISLAEVSAAIAAKARAPQGISLKVRDRALKRFLQDCEEQYLLWAASREAIDEAVRLTQRRKLRGCDAIQLASAVAYNRELLAEDLPPLIFVASDEDLLAAADAEGLAAINPAG
jgi:predicted nucleic acid-binding protein